MKFNSIRIGPFLKWNAEKMWLHSAALKKRLICEKHRFVWISTHTHTPTQKQRAHAAFDLFVCNSFFFSLSIRFHNISLSNSICVFYFWACVCVSRECSFQRWNDMKHTLWVHKNTAIIERTFIRWFVWTFRFGFFIYTDSVYSFISFFYSFTLSVAKYNWTYTKQSTTIASSKCHQIT